MRVGFIGLGHMGSAMAANLLKAGHEVTVYNRTRAKAEPLLAGGARIADSLGDACRGDVVFSMLADDAAVENAINKSSPLPKKKDGTVERELDIVFNLKDLP